MVWRSFPNGRDGKRIRRQFATKGEAQSYEKFVKEQAQNKPWLGEKAVKRQNHPLQQSETVTPRTVNLDLAYFRAMFNELRRLDEWTAPNPLENVREFKISESEMAYLTIEEIRILLAECENSRSKDLTTIVKICLAAGARWRKAEGLKGNQIRAGQIIYVKIKGKKNRAVPITEKL